MINIPFDIKIAKEIQSGKCPGKIVTENGKNVRIICWDAKSDYPFYALILEKNTEKLYEFDIYGENLFYKLRLIVPEWRTLKIGDIVIYEEKSITIQKGIAILSSEVSYSKSNNSPVFNASVILDFNTSRLRFDSGLDKNIVSIRLAYKNEMQDLIPLLQKSSNSTALKILKEIFNISKFEPFDKVLVRTNQVDPWEAALFSHITDNEKYPYFTVGGFTHSECIPYNEGTKHLLGTTLNWE